MLAGARIVEGTMRRLSPPVLESFSPGPGFRRDQQRRDPPFPPPMDRPPPRANWRDGNNPGMPPPTREFPPRRSLQERLPPQEASNQIPDFKPEIEWTNIERLLPGRLKREPEEVVLIVWGPDGETLFSKGTNERSLKWSQVDMATLKNALVLRQMRGSTRDLLIRGPSETTICFGLNVTRELNRMSRFSAFLLATALGTFALAWLGGAWCLKRTLGPMATIEQIASTIGADRLNERLPVDAMDTELADVATAINGMLDRLQSGFERQREFTADASHELRTPLAILLSSTELALSKERSAEAYRTELEKCQRAAQRMNGLVDSLLTLSRLDPEKQHLPMEQVNLSQLSVEHVDYYRELAGKKKITFHIDIDPCTVLGERGLLERLISNLLINAITYNKEGGWVKLALKYDTDGCILTVTDNGYGIPAPDLPHIFTRFYRVDKARSRMNGGSGLGLAICDSVVRLHHGSISVESTENEGTQFKVHLPCIG
ncbi:MAG: HAMP domain-containing protein [Planctomycetes bacterium]|nr:HAMP domain-containing protein [Planctomycetota bacterium]